MKNFDEVRERLTLYRKYLLEVEHWMASSPDKSTPLPKYLHSFENWRSKNETTTKGR